MESRSRKQGLFGNLVLGGAVGGKKNSDGAVFSSRVVLFPNSPAGGPSTFVVICLIYFFKSACLFVYMHFYSNFLKAFIVVK